MLSGSELRDAALRWGRDGVVGPRGTRENKQRLLESQGRICPWKDPGSEIALKNNNSKHGGRETDGQDQKNVTDC